VGSYGDIGGCLDLVRVWCGTEVCCQRQHVGCWMLACDTLVVWPSLGSIQYLMSGKIASSLISSF